MRVNKKKNMWFLLLIISLGGGVIFMLPYIQYTFYDSMMGELNFNNTQMGNIMSVYGSLNLVAYFLGGIMADRFSSRKLIAFSLIATGISGFWFASFPSYGSMLIISAIWSFTTIFTYWPAMIKAVTLLGDSDVQGRLFGFREALNSLGALVFSSTALFIFNKYSEDFQKVIIFYSILYIVIGIVSYIFIPEMKNTVNNKGRKLFTGLGHVLRNPNVWLIGFIIFFGYAIGSVMGRLTPYLTNVFNMGVTTAAIVGIINTYGVGNVGAAAGGIITDKLKSSTRFMKYCFIIMGVLLSIFVLIPGKPNLLFIIIILGLTIRLVQTAVRGVYFVPLDESKIPKEYLGTAAGVVSVIGFLPDAFLFTIYGNILDKYPEDLGYKIMFGSLIGFSIVGFILTSIFIKRMKSKN